jgi:hypothetical protein
MAKKAQPLDTDYLTEHHDFEVLARVAHLTI